LYQKDKILSIVIGAAPFGSDGVLPVEIDALKSVFWQEGDKGVDKEFSVSCAGAEFAPMKRNVSFSVGRERTCFGHSPGLMGTPNVAEVKTPHGNPRLQSPAFQRGKLGVKGNILRVTWNNRITCRIN
jgi:hypothetical protein